MTIAATLDRARGHWRDILLALGVDKRFLSAQPGECPVCRGKGCFRFVDTAGDGWFTCRACGHGSGFALLRMLHGWNQASVIAAIEGVLSILGRDEALLDGIGQCPGCGKLLALKCLWQGGQFVVMSTGLPIYGACPSSRQHPSCTVEFAARLLAVEPPRRIQGPTERSVSKWHH